VRRILSALFNIEGADYDRLVDDIDHAANGLLLSPGRHSAFDRMAIAFERNVAGSVRPRKAAEQERLTVTQGEHVYHYIRLATDASRPYGDQLATQHEGVVDLTPVEGSAHPAPSVVALRIHAALARILRASARSMWDEYRPATPPMAAPAVLAKEGGERGAMQLARAFARHGHRC
jgi:hypothetical protein